MDPEEVRKQLKKWAIVALFFLLAVALWSLGWRRALLAYLLLVGVVSVLAILLQSGKGGGLATSLGGMGADSLLGARSATPIAKATYVLLALFIFISMLIARPRHEAAEKLELLPEQPAAGRPAPAPEPSPGSGHPAEAQPND